MTDFYCSAIHKNIRLDIDVQTKSLQVLPCCVYKTTNQYTSLEQYESSEEIRSLKTATEWPGGCDVCRTQEQQNQTSYRQQANQSLKNISGRRYEVMPSNVCNLRCLMCNSKASTALAKERFQVGIDSKNLAYDVDVSRQQLAILAEDTEVESISLIGGEFFLNKNSLEFLDLVIQRNIPLRVVTNATVILEPFISKLQQIQNLELQISIDGRDAGYEFMRYPAKWSVFDSIASEIIQRLKTAKINFHFVAQPLNIQQLVPVMDYANQQRKPLRVTNLVAPKNLSWQILTDAEKSDLNEVIATQLTQYRLATSQKNEVENYLKLMKNTVHNSALRAEFDVYVNSMVEKRTIDWPALKESNLHPRVRSTVFCPLN